MMEHYAKILQHHFKSTARFLKQTQAWCSAGQGPQAHIKTGFAMAKTYQYYASGMPKALSLTLNSAPLLPRRLIKYSVIIMPEYC